MIATRSFKKLFHIGSLNVSDKRTNSMEGSGLSVSLDPDAWRKIGRGIVTGSTWICSKPNNKFIDAHKLKNNKKVIQWGLDNGFVKLENTYVISRYDDELDDTYELVFSTREEAEAEKDEDDSIIIRTGSLVGTEKLSIRTKTNYTVGLVYDLLLTVFAEEHGFDGVWWQDKLDVMSYSAPRGVIVPSKVSSWSFEKEVLAESADRILYHGTLFKNLPAILQNGLIPQTGEFTKSSYDELPDEYFQDLVFAADRQTLYKCVSAIISQMRLANIPVTLENFIRHGAIVSFKYTSDFKQHSDDEEHPSTVEPEDYYTDDDVVVSGVYVRKKMMSLLKRNNVVSIKRLKSDFLSEETIEDPEFKRWFGESKIVDKNGLPLICYHGTDKAFQEFERGLELQDSGIYFSPDHTYASGYANSFQQNKVMAGANLRPCYLSIQNPAFFLTKPTDIQLKLGNKGAFTDAVISHLESLGHDGVVVGVTDYEVEIGHKSIADAHEICVFNPRQIRSVFSVKRKVSENWVTDVTSSGERETISVYHNPSRKEFIKALRDSTGTLRGWLGNTDLVIFDADEVHDKVWKQLKVQKMDNIIPKNPINIHLDKENPFIDTDNWIAISAEEDNLEPLRRAEKMVLDHPILKQLYTKPELIIRDSY